MNRLSYSTANAAINAPHTYLNKIMGLDTFTTSYFEEGKKAHRLVQDSVSGVLEMAELANIPSFEVVEKSDFDETCHVAHTLNDDWEIHGYVDMISHEHKRFGDIKSGGRWGVGKAHAHPQFAGYSLMLGYNDFWLVNLPRDPLEWNANTIRVYNFTFTKKQHQKAIAFFEKAIYTIEHLKESLAEEVKNRKPGRSPYCFYKSCEFCDD